jgi:hypothetical protein
MPSSSWLPRRSEETHEHPPVVQYSRFSQTLKRGKIKKSKTKKFNLEKTQILPSSEKLSKSFSVINFEISGNK